MHMIALSSPLLNYHNLVMVSLKIMYDTIDNRAIIIIGHIYDHNNIIDNFIYSNIIYI